MAEKALITAGELRAILQYDPETGHFTWLVQMSDRIAPGCKAGLPRECGWYPRVNINRKQYYAHRLAWLWMTGEWPKVQIDHANGDRSDNRWGNLREATRAQNNSNKVSFNKHNLKGVSFHKLSGLWRAHIRKNGADYPLGYFSSKEEAHAAYRRGADRLHGEFANTSCLIPKKGNAQRL